VRAEGMFAAIAAIVLVASAACGGNPHIPDHEREGAQKPSPHHTPTPYDTDTEGEIRAASSGRVPDGGHSSTGEANGEGPETPSGSVNGEDDDTTASGPTPQ
jgi:hypothetical protein